MSLFFLRHGEAFHNTDECKKLKEPPTVSPLTEIGKQQACSVVVPDNITEIWVSPSRRTMETAYLAGLHPFHIKYELAEIDKRIMFRCNGGDKESLKEFIDKGSVLSTNEEVELLNEKEHTKEIEERINVIKCDIDEWLQKNKNGTLVIVGHIHIFKHLSGLEIDKAQIIKIK